MIHIDDPDYNSDDEDNLKPLPGINPEGQSIMIEPRELAEGEKLESGEVPVESPIWADNRALPGLTEGRWVHYVLPNGDHRPALVVNAWNGGIGSDHLVNLDVHTDYSNDLGAYEEFPEELRDRVRHGHFWMTSVPHDPEGKQPNSWHWIEPK